MPNKKQTSKAAVTRPDVDLGMQVHDVFENAIDAYRRRLKIYQSLQNLNEVIGTEYGDRVLYELIQNAHDAHRSGHKGQIEIKLVISSENEGVLYVANGGDGFRSEDVEAIRNIAISAKEVGEGIGNKGLGFRSIEALTDKVQIYSSNGSAPKNCFNGYCFRFAEQYEIENLLKSYPVEDLTRRDVARTIPRYLVPLPLTNQPGEIKEYAFRGFATVIAVPLRTADAVDLASRQIKELTEQDVPLLLFLDRIEEITINIERCGQEPYSHHLTRQQMPYGGLPSLPDTQMYEVRVGGRHSYLVVRREIDKERILTAVKDSISAAPQLKRWLEWKGTPIVSVAVGISPGTVSRGRLYNFLPMGEDARSPLTGHIDAPFYADIDRRDAKFSLPLNKTLMEAAAETCVATALSIVKNNMPFPVQSVFDLFAWTGGQAEKLDAALKKAGSSLRNACIIPAVAAKNGEKAWSNLSEITIWPKGPFAVLKAKDVVKHIGVQLVSSALDKERIDLLEKVADRAYLSLEPSDAQLAKWSEDFAYSLKERKAAPRTWSMFYNDLHRLFDTSDADLGALCGKTFLFDRSGMLRPASGTINGDEPDVFVRKDIPKGKRKKKGVPLPPGELSRRYRFLHEKITFRPETLDAFIKAGLVRKYDPVEALAGLKAALGRKANDKRRREALIWAFKVWRTSRKQISDELQQADLYVPTLSGWHPAGQAAFSSSWTAVGETLENYLVEGAEVSADCRRIRELLLVGQKNWPVSVRDEKRNWVKFLKQIGVNNGVIPIPAQLKDRGSPSDYWDQLLRKGETAEGLGENWCTEVANVSFYHPYTDDYKIKGSAWRLPGQMEYDELSSNAREALCTLIFDHLTTQGKKYLWFSVGRFERYQRDWDFRRLPTPLGVFLRSKAWITAVTQEGSSFRKPKDCWASRQRRGGPPRFVARVPDYLISLSQESELAELVFSEDIGLRDWQSAKTAIERLRDLASVSQNLSSKDRPKFRNEHRNAWGDLAESEDALPNDLDLVVTRLGQYEILSGSSDSPTKVIITENAQSFEARVLSSAGQAVLEVGQAETNRIDALLGDTGIFITRHLDGVGVQLLVDGETFIPRVGDPPLTSLGLEWLPEVIIIGHQLRGEQLERAIRAETVDKKTRAIRVRRCDEISLVVDEEEVSPSEKLKWYAYEHEDLPTLIITNDQKLDWRTLAWKLSGGISRLIDTRLRFLEPLLLKLAFDRVPDDLSSPSDESLAKVLECDVQTIQDHRAELRTNLDHILHVLVPVVAYYSDIELSNKLQEDVDRAEAKFNVRRWLELNLENEECSPGELFEACEQAMNREDLRRRLGLNFERFNRVLLDLGEEPVSNEAELKHLYEAYLEQMRSEIVDRLRRHYVADFIAGKDLTAYVEQKRLQFLEFNVEWILSRETLEMDVVNTHVSALLDEVLGEDIAGELAPFKRVVQKNRKTVGDFAVNAMSIVQAWCRQNDAQLPPPWIQGDAKNIVRQLENKGILDFFYIEPQDIPDLCVRAASWPDGMAKTIKKSSLGLSLDDLRAEEERREREKRQAEIKKRSITFFGTELDTGDVMFAADFQKLAESCLSKDETWFTRSRQQTRLVGFDNSQQHTGGSGGGGKGKTKRRRERKLTSEQRQAMGLASEWLAYQFLCRRHKNFADETCWISENRTYFFGGDAGDDSAGFDFRIKTPNTEWLYEVKSSQEDSREFELTANQIRVASETSKDGRRRFRILYVPYVFTPERWCVFELPNPMKEDKRNLFKVVGKGSVRLQFEHR